MSITRYAGSDQRGGLERELPPILCQNCAVGARPTPGGQTWEKFITYPPSDRLGFSLPSSPEANRKKGLARLAFCQVLTFLHMPHDVLRRQR